MRIATLTVLVLVASASRKSATSGSTRSRQLTPAELARKMQRESAVDFNAKLEKDRLTQERMMQQMEQKLSHINQTVQPTKVSVKPKKKELSVIKEDIENVPLQSNILSGIFEEEMQKAVEPSKPKFSENIMAATTLLLRKLDLSAEEYEDIIGTALSSVDSKDMAESKKLPSMTRILYYVMKRDYIADDEMDAKRVEIVRKLLALKANPISSAQWEGAPMQHLSSWAYSPLVDDLTEELAAAIKLNYSNNLNCSSLRNIDALLEALVRKGRVRALSALREIGCQTQPSKDMLTHFFFPEAGTDEEKALEMLAAMAKHEDLAVVLRMPFITEPMVKAYSHAYSASSHDENLPTLSELADARTRNKRIYVSADGYRFELLALPTELAKVRDFTPDHAAALEDAIAVGVPILKLAREAVSKSNAEMLAALGSLSHRWGHTGARVVKALLESHNVTLLVELLARPEMQRTTPNDRIVMPDRSHRTLAHDVIEYLLHEDPSMVVPMDHLSPAWQAVFLTARNFRADFDRLKRGEGGVHLKADLVLSTFVDVSFAMAKNIGEGDGRLASCSFAEAIAAVYEGETDDSWMIPTRDLFVMHARAQHPLAADVIEAAVHHEQNNALHMMHADLVERNALENVRTMDGGAELVHKLERATASRPAMEVIRESHESETDN